MPLKTVAQQLMEQEEEAKKGKKHKVHKSSSSGNPFRTFAAIVLLILGGSWFFQTFVQPQAGYYAVSGDSNQRMTSLAYQQGQLSYSMTQQAGQVIAQTSDAAARIQATAQAQQANSTAQAAATAWAMTQPALTATAMRQELENKQMMSEYEWEQMLIPFKVFAPWVIFYVGVAVLFIFVIIAFAMLMPILKMRFGIVKEDRGERTIHLGEKEITRTDLMPAPTLTRQTDGTMQPNGGFEDPHLQLAVTQQAAQVKIVQSLPPAVRLPGRTPDMVKGLPELDVLGDVIDGQVKDMPNQLVQDVRHQLDSGEEDV